MRAAIALHSVISVWAVSVVVVSAPQLAAQERAPGEAVPVRVFLQFNGDPGFPGLTWQGDTRGLQPLFGTAFELQVHLRQMLIDRIVAHIRQDYAAYANISFVTSTQGLRFWYTWGIDDRAYVFYEDDVVEGRLLPINPSLPCQAGAPCLRLFGKAIGSLDPGDRDLVNDRPIHHPTFARTFAGSFALREGSADPSEPPLIWITDPPESGLIDINAIAQALANKASHEIAHLFGLPHFVGVTNLMFQRVERFEAFQNKVFNVASQDRLRRVLEDFARADAFETNDTPARARSLALGAHSGLTLDSPIDADHYSVSLPSGAATTIEISFDRSFYAGPPTRLDDWANVSILSPAPEELAAASGNVFRRRFEVSVCDPARQLVFKVYQRIPRVPMPYGITVSLESEAECLVDNGDGTVSDTCSGLM